MDDILSLCRDCHIDPDLLLCRMQSLRTRPVIRRSMFAANLMFTLLCGIRVPAINLVALKKLRNCKSYSHVV